jgi:cell division topological specificity factor
MSLLDRLLGRSNFPGSGDVAKKRLKLVLEYDRSNLTPEELEKIRDEIIRSISRHVAIDSDDVEISLQRNGRLVAEIPLERRDSRGSR